MKKSQAQIRRRTHFTFEFKNIIYCCKTRKNPAPEDKLFVNDKTLPVASAVCKPVQPAELLKFGLNCTV